jgi:hypothetical protein
MSDLLRLFVWPMLANLVPLGIIAAVGWFQI